MAQFSISTLRGAISNPARSHLFRCLITPSGLINSSLSIFTEAFGIGTGETRSYLCKIATIPELVVETGEVYYFTRAVKYPTRRRYTPLTLTFFNTTDYTLRKAFEKWSHVLLNPSENTGFLGFAGSQRSTEGTATIQVQHYDGTSLSSTRKPNLIRDYTFYQAYPSSIGPLMFSYDNDTEIQTFDVTMEYNYFVGDEATNPIVNTSYTTNAPPSPPETEDEGN